MKPARLLLLLLAPAMSFAAQFVLFDVTFTYTKADADNATPSKSHYYVKGDKINPDRPRDWTSPIDYRNGTVHIRAEILEKPAGGEPTTWTMCYIPNKGQGNGYGCTGTDLYTQTGVYEKDVKMTSWWENNSIIWTEGIKQIDLVIKDNSGGSGHAHKRADHEKFFPTKVRLMMVQVSAGATYDPSLAPGVKAGRDRGQVRGVIDWRPRGGSLEFTAGPPVRATSTAVQLANHGPLPFSCWVAPYLDLFREELHALKESVTHLAIAS